MEGDIVASAILVDPILPLGVVECKGLPRSQWIMKCVLLKDDNGDSVAFGVCHSVCPNLVLTIFLLNWDNILILGVFLA